MDTWQLIAAERAAVLEGLAGLTDAEWAAPSLCRGWTNREVLAHLVATAETTPPKWLLAMARNGFRFNAMVAADIAALAGESTAVLLERLRADIPRRDHPPGPAASWLLETVAHAEDIAFPLRRRIAHLPDALRVTADFTRTAQPLIGARKRIAGLRLQATDLDWSTGDGPEVSGPMVPLLLAMCGRSSTLDALTGAGVTVLRERG